MNGDKDPQIYAIIGAAMEVHRELGGGFLESVYQDALTVELGSRRIPFERESVCPVRYKGGVLPSQYKANFVCFAEIIVELKVLKTLSTADDAKLSTTSSATVFTVRFCSISAGRVFKPNDSFLDLKGQKLPTLRFSSLRKSALICGDLL